MDRELNMDLRDTIWAFFVLNRDLVLAKSEIGRGADQEEAVHVLRVATKKIRTVYRLCEAVAPRAFRQKKAIAELRVLFRSAGALREMQVHQAVIDGYETIQVAYYRKISKLLLRECRAAAPFYEQERKRFRRSSFDAPSAKIKAILREVSEQEVHLATVAFTQMRLQAVQAVMPSGYDPKLIHQARIYLKEAMYLIGILHTAGYTDDFSGEWLATAKLAAESAGDWHDREVLYEWLQIQIRPSGPLRNEEKGYALLMQDLHVHTRSLVKRFREAIEPLQLPQASSTEAGQ